ncbi:MAG TPA: hypothetical protein VK338_06180 [Candidatus Nitrosocosmicus sp.]|nr:hypothetical protein [Candidatus Nitrosocosmicus sp.]
MNNILSLLPRKSMTNLKPLTQQVNELRQLLNEWDPAYLFPNQGDLQEYDSLISPILGLLKDHKDYHTITTFLETYIHNYFAVTADKTKLDTFVKKLLEWKSIWKLHETER